MTYIVKKHEGAKVLEPIAKEDCQMVLKAVRSSLKILFKNYDLQYSISIISQIYTSIFLS